MKKTIRDLPCTVSHIYLSKKALHFSNFLSLQKRLYLSDESLLVDYRCKLSLEFCSNALVRNFQLVLCFSYKNNSKEKHRFTFIIDILTNR